MLAIAQVRLSNRMLTSYTKRWAIQFDVAVYG